jgi:hypothetical protein
LLPHLGAQCVPMETILSYVRRRLRDVGPPEWPAIVAETQVNSSIPRKLAYERENTRVNALEPIYRYFLHRDYGSSALPHERPAITKKGR